MKNLITKLIITLVTTMFSLSVFGQLSEDDQIGADCLAKGSQVKYEVEGRGNLYEWIVNTSAGTKADAICYTIVSPTNTSNKIEIKWNKEGLYKLILIEKTSTGICKDRENVMQIEVVDIENRDKNTFEVKPLNNEFCAADLSSQTLFVDLKAGKDRVIAYPVILKYTIGGVGGVKEVTFSKSEVQKDLTNDLVNLVLNGTGDEVINIDIISITNKYGTDLEGPANTKLIVHKPPVQSEILVEDIASACGGLTPYVKSYHRYSTGNAAISTSLYLWRIKKGTSEAVRFTTDPTGKTNQEIFDAAVSSTADYVIVSKNTIGEFVYAESFPIVSDETSIDADFADKTKAADNFEIYIYWLKIGEFTLLSNEFTRGTSCYTTTAEKTINVQDNAFTGELSWNSYTTNLIPTDDIKDNTKVVCAQPDPTENVINFTLKAIGYNKNWKYTYRVGIKYSDTQTSTINGTNTILDKPLEADWKQTADTHGHDWTQLYSSNKVEGTDVDNINVNKVLEAGGGFIYVWVKVFLMEDGSGSYATNPKELVRCAVLKQLPKKQNMILD